MDAITPDSNSQAHQGKTAGAANPEWRLHGADRRGPEGVKVLNTNAPVLRADRRCGVDRRVIQPLPGQHRAHALVDRRRSKTSGGLVRLINKPFQSTVL